MWWFFCQYYICAHESKSFVANNVLTVAFKAFIFETICGAKHSLIGLKIKKWCFREKMNLEVFDFKNCDDFSINIKFPSADQHLLWRRIFWLLHFGLVLLKLLETCASFLNRFKHFCSSLFLVFFLQWSYLCLKN